MLHTLTYGRNIGTQGYVTDVDWELYCQEVLDANFNEGIHHNLLDAKPEFCKMYLTCQAAYNHSEKTEDDQYYFLRDVVWLYIDAVADELGDEYKLHDKPRQEIEDEVLAIELDIRKQQLHVIDGGKS